MDNLIKESISISIQARVPVLAWGGPGTGKTSFMNALAKDLGVPIETIIASIREPSDFGGLPIVTEHGVVLSPPAWAKRLASFEVEDDILTAICFIDEISTAPPAVQAALLRVIHERVVGDITLPTGVAMVAAANPPEQAAGGWTLSPPLANRFVHFEWDLDPREWTELAVQNWDAHYDLVHVPEEWTELVPAQRALVASYIRSRPNVLYQYPQTDSEAGKAWPSPRSWDTAGKLLAAVEATGASRDVKMTTLAGAVGYGPASEFVVWTDDLDLPDPEDLLSDPKKFKMPDRADKQFAVLSAVVSAVLNNLTNERWVAAWDILSKAAEATKGPDIAAFAAKALAKRIDSDLTPPVKQIAVFTPILREANLI